MGSFLLLCHVYIDLTVRSTVLQLRVHESTTFEEVGNLCGIWDEIHHAWVCGGPCNKQIFFFV